jgi:hypothetical protein
MRDDEAAPASIERQVFKLYASAKRDLIRGTTAVEDRLDTLSDTYPVRVVAFSTGQSVGANAAKERVVANPAIQCIVAS